VDIIFCGKQAIDGDTAQVGPELAEHLGIAQVTYVSKMDIDGEIARVEREMDEGYEIIRVKLPVLVSVIKSHNYEPRYGTFKGVMRACRVEIPTWTAADMTVDEQRLGLKGSSTQVKRIFTPPQRVQGVVISRDSAREAAAELLEMLSEAKIV
jgi:electron transfer flavoprotein alpha/beta subunit